MSFWWRAGWPIAQGRGHGVFANVALAVLAAQASGRARRVAVVDWDVHHGNGTQDAFYEDSSVLTISIHQYDNYPKASGGLDERGVGSGLGFNINVPLPPGSGHGAYLESIDRVMVPALRRFEPDLIVVACGLDASGMDPLGRMMCHSGTFRGITGRLMAAARDLCKGRLVLCHEGGYSPRQAAYCGLAIVEVLSGFVTGLEDSSRAWLAGFAGQELLAHQDDLIRRAEDLVDGISLARI